ncbi:MAG: putative iron-regulated membrane protein, partial [Candidatus Azotimanducaceae bacterium]
MRRLLINVHLYLAAFLAPMLLLVAVSGGLYLLNIKGEVTREAVVMPAGSNLDTEAPTLEADVRALLAEAGI